MTPYQRQHYLPVVYLKQFAIDPSLPRGKLRIWRCDGTRNHDVSVESQCAGHFHYSKQNAEVVEKMFGSMERFYADSLNKIKEQQTLPSSEVHSLIVAIGDMHARNASYTNKTGRDNFYAYRIQIRAFMATLVGRPKGTPTDSQVVDHLVSYWSACLIPCDGYATPLITSDNPVVCFGTGTNRTRLSLMMMPLAPDCLAVAFDKRIHRVKREFLNSEDVGELWHLQCRRAIQSIYSWQQLEPRHAEAVREIFADNPVKNGGVTTARGVSIPLFRFPEDRKLSFIVPAATIL